MPEGQPPECEPGEPLRVNVLFKHIQRMLTADSAVMAETGDSWFHCQKLRLPDGCGYVRYGGNNTIDRRRVVSLDHCIALIITAVVVC